MPDFSFYTAYGLTIASALPLPELPPAAAGAADISIVFGEFGGFDTPHIDEGPYTRAVPGEAHLLFRGTGAFAVRDGREIVIESAPGVDDGTLRMFVLGPCLGLALHQRGELVLHASAAAIDGAACLFLGNSGDGKSALCAALAARGHAVLTDDVAAVAFRDDGPVVHPGPASIKLWPDAAGALGHDAATLPRVCTGEEKRALPIDAAQRGPVPLRRIYVLDRGPEHGIHPLRPSEAVIEAVRYGYCTLFARLTDTASGHFRRCSALAAAAPAARLVRIWDLAALAALAGIVEDDLAAS